jgi:hypothetical protein
MTSYYVEIKKCPNCTCKFTALSVGSRNTFGATQYTDGFTFGEMYDESSALLVCPSCSAYLWRKEAPTQKVVDDFYDLSNPALLRAEEVSGRKYIDVLRRALWKTDAQEKYLRIRVWWLLNHVYRRPNAKKFILSPEQAKNLTRLLELLDPSDANDALMKAEIFRELGRFDKCFKQLRTISAASLLPTVSVIKNLAKKKKRRVGIVWGDGEYSFLLEFAAQR